jgi:hypothetical protein
LPLPCDNGEEKCASRDDDAAIIRHR